MTVQLGQVTTLVISSASAAKQVLQKQDISFANRTVPDSIRACEHADNSMAWSHLSPKWRNLRKLCYVQIFSYQKMQAMESLRSRKIQELIEDVRECASLRKAVVIAEAGFKTSLNLMSNILISVDLDKPNSNMGREFEESFMNIMKIGAVPNLVDYFPLMTRFDPQRIRARMATYFSGMLNLVDSIISERLARRVEAEHKCSVSENRNFDVLDSLLDIAQDSTQNITTKDIKHLFLDMFVGGTDTVSTILEWAMSEVIRNPEVMKKAKAELNNVIGKGNQVKESDIQHLPYLQAIVKESLRLHPVLPLLIPRKVITNVELCGYTVPKDTQVLINVWAIGRDCKTWGENADSFVPERFLGSEVDVKGGDYELLPFGAGRRICIGMPLAHRMMHLMLGSLVNCIDWELEGGLKVEDLNMDEMFGILLQKAHHLRAVPVVVS